MERNPTPRRIHIIGGPGSGKSYAANELAQRMGIPAYDLDNLFWDRAANCYGVRAPEAERDTRLSALVQQEAWIIEGVYYSWVQPSFERADIIGVLRPPILLRDWRIVRRFVRRKLGLDPVKRERLVDLYRLILWNHRYHAFNLMPALERIRQYHWKVLACPSADDLIEHLSGRGRSRI